ncbi:PspC domain-containing protein [Streptococcus cameli]
MFGIYKKTENKVVSGVLAGVAEKFNWDLSLTRMIFVAIVLFSPVSIFAIIAYIVAALKLPQNRKNYYYEAPLNRKRKDADIIDDGKWFT